MYEDIEPPSNSSFITKSELNEQLKKIMEIQKERHTQLQEEVTRMIINQTNKIEILNGSTGETSIPSIQNEHPLCLAAIKDLQEQLDAMRKKLDTALPQEGDMKVSKRDGPPQEDPTFPVSHPVQVACVSSGNLTRLCLETK